MEDFMNFISSEEFVPMLADWTMKLVLAVVILVIGRWIAKMITRAFRRAIHRESIEDTLEDFLGNILYVILMVSVVLAALDTLNVPITSLLAIVGAAGLAIGLALKDSLGNFASGVMLIMFRPFTKGDFVEVAGTAGKVEEVRIFNTVLTTPDNKKIVIPNGLVAGDTITNYTASETRRVDMVFGVSYDDDLKVARDVLSRVVGEHPKVLSEPAPVIVVGELADSSVNFNVRPWAKTADYWDVYWDVLEIAKVELEAAGCSIPYPQRDVHMHEAGA